MWIRDRRARDIPVVERFLVERDTRMCARAGKLVDALAHPALLAEENGELIGVLTYILEEKACEVLTIHVEDSWRGVGTALLEKAEHIALQAGCDVMFLTTTNDNLDALRFYQRRGFQLTRLLPGAVDESRMRLKPTIPMTGAHGIPLRDEIVLRREL
ncbi:MAG: GNAT family N-acetyltransferase [Actinobacteria bacterium]|nr:GNAT family N-acetyltransferase [Actinomycetota bacterium]